MTPSRIDRLRNVILSGGCASGDVLTNLRRDFLGFSVGDCWYERTDTVDAATGYTIYEWKPST